MAGTHGITSPTEVAATLRPVRRGSGWLAVGVHPRGANGSACTVLVRSATTHRLVACDYQTIEDAALVAEGWHSAEAAQSSIDGYRRTVAS